MQNRGGSGYAWATPPPIGTGRQGQQRLMKWELSGWVFGAVDGKVVAHRGVELGV